MPDEQQHTIGATSLSAGTWTGAGFATAGDYLVIQKGSQSITDSVDQSANSQIGTFVTGKLFTGSIGTAASPMQFGATGVCKNAAPQGNVWVTPQASDNNVIGTWEQIGAGQVHFIGSGTVTTARQAQGVAEYGANIDVPTTEQFGGRSRFDDSTNTHDTIIMRGGTMVTERDLTSAGTILIAGGSLMQVNPGATMANSTVIDVYGGLFMWSGGFGTANQVNWYGGSIDFGSIAIADTLAELNIYPGVSGGVATSVVNKLTNTSVNYRVGASSSVSGGLTLGGTP